MRVSATLKFTEFTSCAESEIAEIRVHIYIYACAASTHTASQTRINPRNASKVKSRNYRGTLTRRAGRNPFDNETRFLEREISKEETCFLRGEKKKKKKLSQKMQLSLFRNDIRQVKRICEVVIRLHKTF